MAEENQPIVSNQRLIVAISIVLVIVALFLLWNFRGCMPISAINRGPAYVNIYTNLELKDAANVITRLKELKIPYRVEQSGTAITVLKERADDARLGLAEKNLPQGGAVGWEIFNETKMGATDFDRRIQLIRAISGELSRTIKRIDGVDDVRVQIVLPETRLFEVSKAPVTAAVLLKMLPGLSLRPEQINGIIHLVASSVENLKAENVTIVDDMGNILSNKVVLAEEVPAQKIIVKEYVPQKEIPQEIVKKAAPVEKQEVPKPQTLKEIVKEKIETKKITEDKPKFKLSLPFAAWLSNKKKETIEKIEPKEPKELKEPKEKAVVAAPPVVKKAPLTEEEKAILKLKAKEEYERQLTAKVQELLNQFYPTNGVIVRVNVLFGDNGWGIKSTKLKIRSDAGFIIAPVKKITTIVLIDNSFNLSKKLKKSTYQTIAVATSYNKLRGDKIILKQVPFHYAEVPKISDKKNNLSNYLAYILLGIAAIVLLIIVFVVRRSAKPKQVSKMPFERHEDEAQSMAQAPSESEATSTVQQIQELAKGNPERLANLLKKWLTEEE